MNATTPLEIEEDIYPYYSINLAITTNYIEGKEIGNAALRLVPTRIDASNNTILKHENSIPVLLNTSENLQEPERVAVEAIYSALQTYIISKGL